VDGAAAWASLRVRAAAQNAAVARSSSAGGGDVGAKRRWRKAAAVHSVERGQRGRAAARAAHSCVQGCKTWRLWRCAGGGKVERRRRDGKAAARSGSSRAAA